MAKTKAFKLFIWILWIFGEMTRRVSSLFRIQKTRIDFRFDREQQEGDLKALVLHTHNLVREFCKGKRVAIYRPWIYVVGPWDGCVYLGSTDSDLIRQIHQLIAGLEFISHIREVPAKDRIRL